MAYKSVARAGVDGKVRQIHAFFRVFSPGKIMHWSLFCAIALITAISACKMSSESPPPSPIFTVTFDKNHSDTSGWTDANPKTITVTDPDTTVGSLPSNPTRSGWEFYRWNTSPNGNGLSFTASTAVTESITVFAQWLVDDPAAIKVYVSMIGNVEGDSVTVAPVSGNAGDTVTLSYSLADTAFHNRLVFSGTTPVIEQVDSTGDGTRQYVINADDAAEGVITINAMFSHSDLELDTIAFDDDHNVEKIYGDSSFTRAITNTGAGLGAISYSSSEASVATVNSSTGTVTILKAGQTTITATKASDGEYAETIVAYTLHVNHRQLTISGTVVETSKVYDGNDNAAVTTVGALGNVVGGDMVEVSASATYNSPYAEHANLITVVYAISGAGADNYIKPANYEIAGEITGGGVEPFDPDRAVIIDFESDATGKTYNVTNGNGTGTATVISDPANGGEKSLQLTITNYNRGAIIPFNLPYALQNYKYFSFRFMYVSGTSFTDEEKDISAYVASNTSTFVNYGFGNPSNNSNQFAANLLGQVTRTFTDADQNVWVTYTMDNSDPGVAIQNLQGDLYLAIGINHGAALTILFDDLTFVLKDNFTMPAKINASGTQFDKAEPQDIAVEITLNDAGSLTSIQNGSATLSSGSDYTVTGTGVTLNQSYLAAQDDGNITLTFNFSAGTPSTLNIQIANTSTGGSFGLLEYDFTTMSEVPSGITAGTGLNLSISGAGLKVDKTTGYSTVFVTIPFDLGTTNLTDYNLYYAITPISGTSDFSGTYKNLNIGLNSESSNLVNRQVQIVLNTAITDTVSLSSSATGEITLSVAFNNVPASAYEIQALRLVLK